MKVSAAAALLVLTSANKIPLHKRNLTMAHIEASKETLANQISSHYLLESNNRSIHLKDYMNTQYMVEVSLGTPPQSFLMIPDTGSSNVWVYDEACDAVACYIHDKFKHSKSSTFQDDSTHEFVLHYGSGGINGVQAFDNVSLGSTEADHFHMGLVQAADGVAFLASDMCGIIGLAWPEISQYGMPIYADKALAAGNRNFAFYLHSNPEESYMTFPGIDESVSALTDFTFHNVIEDRYWSLDLKSFGGVDLSGTKGVIDSGTSLIVGAQSQIDAILNGATVSPDCSDLD